MNRRDFLKLLGSLPLVGLAAKLPTIQNQDEFGIIVDGVDNIDGKVKFDFEPKHPVDPEDFELGWNMVFNDDTGELQCMEVNLAKLMRAKLDDYWHHIAFDYPNGKMFVDGKPHE